MTRTRKLLLSAGLPFAALLLLASASRAAEPELSFVVIGDWGKGSVEQRQVANALGRVAESHHARFVVSTGDNFYPNGVKSVTDPNWKILFEDVYTAPALQVPWHVALGNHDHRGSTSAQIAYSKTSKRWSLPAAFYKHSERDGGVSADFFFLDTTPLYQASRWPWKLWPFENEQYAWLERELKASDAEWKIVVGHHPVLSGGGHGSTEVLIDKLRPLLEKYGVDVYLNGHNHALEHVAANGVNYITIGAGADAAMPDSIEGSRFLSGAAGFMAATIGKERMRIELVGQAGETIYRTEVSHPARFAGSANRRP